jgi:hypothetical protein
MLDKLVASFKKNHERKMKFHAEEVDFQKWIFELDKENTFEYVPIYELNLPSNDAVYRTLLNGGFLKHAVDTVPQWGRYALLRDDIFDRFIVSDGKEPKSYYIHGGLGVGKTTILTGIARFLVKILKVSVRHVTAPQLVRLLTSIAKHDKEELESLHYASFLFVDDMGQEKYTTDNQESLMRDFFVVRHGNDRTTFFAGNVDIRNKEEQGIFYTQLSDYMRDSKRFKVLEIDGKSRRK